MNGWNRIRNANKEEVFENLCLFFFALYLIRLFFDTTLFSIPWPVHYNQVVITLLFSILLLKVGLAGAYQGKKWLLCVGISSCFFFSWISTGYTFLAELAVILMGAMEIPYKKILRVYFFVGVSVMALAILGSLSGCIEDLLYDNGRRHSFGIVYTTDFAAHVTYLLLAAWVLLDHLSSKIFFCLSIGTAWCLHVLCGARCSMVVLIGMAVGILYLLVAKSWKNAEGRKRKIIHWIELLQIYFMPLCALFIIGLTMAYRPESRFLNKANQILSNRLSLGKEAFQTYGIKLFGTAFDMIGMGGNTVWREGYNFVDSSYCMILVRYGAVLLIALCILYIYTAKKAVKEKNQRLLLALSLVAMHCVIEHHLPELAYNIFLLLAFAKTEPQKEVAQEKVYIRSIKVFVWGTEGICVILLSPWAMGYCRTLVTVMHLSMPERHRWFLAAMILVVGFLVVAFTQIPKIVEQMVKKEKSYKWSGVAVAMAGIMLCGTMAFSEWILKIKRPFYEEELRYGSELIKKLQEENGRDYKIYVDEIPELYRREVRGISSRILSVDSAVGEKAVIITNKDQEKPFLIKNGYLYGELPGDKGIYVNNDEAAISIRDYGIELYTYYATEKNVDLADMAAANGLIYTESGTLLIEGEGKSLIHGPWITFYEGRIQTNFDLSLIDTSIQKGKIGCIRISSDAGKKVYREKEFTKKDFDEQGHINIILEKGIYTSEGIEFLVIAYEDTILGVNSITYKKIENE